MSAEQIIDLVSDENDDVIVIDDSPRRNNSSEDGASPVVTTRSDSDAMAKEEADDLIPVDMDIEENSIDIQT